MRKKRRKKKNRKGKKEKEKSNLTIAIKIFNTAYADPRLRYLRCGFIVALYSESRLKIPRYDPGQGKKNRRRRKGNVNLFCSYVLSLSFSISSLSLPPEAAT